MSNLEEFDADTLDQDQLAELAMAAAASKTAVRAGVLAPSFRLPDAAGREVGLLDLIATGPVVIHFHRGTWCSFSHGNLAALARAYDDIRAAGADMIAIAPQPSAKAAEVAARHAQALPFRTLTDRTSKVAKAYGVSFNLQDELRGTYFELGYAPPDRPHKEDWPVPIPSTFLIDRRGTVVLAAVDTDYRNQLHPEQILSALRGLGRRSDA